MAGRERGGNVSLRFAVVHEAPADFQTATELADRVLVESIDWLEEEHLEYQRAWLQESGGMPLIWKRVKQLALEAGIDAIGFFGGDPAEPDARAARRAILYLRHALADLAGVLLIRDQDDQPERRVGLEQARRKEEIGGLPVVVGLAVVERECWVLSGFEPKDEVEKEKLAEEIQYLGFHPCRESHQLTACKNDQAKRSPKRVLAKLIGRDRERERECWLLTSLEMLRDRGDGNGLAEYLQEVEDYLVPLITGHERKSG
jgi:hypothetical protein